MTMENLLSQMGIGTKQLTERYSEYGAPVHDPNVYYAYEPQTQSHGHVASSTKHGSGLKSNASMSALTLLAFLFFLHILQQCIKDHMNDMSSSPIVVMTAGRETEDILTKEVKDKVDRSGVTQSYEDRVAANDKIKSIIDKYDAKNPFDAPSNNNRLTKINLAEHIPKIERKKYEHNSSANRNSSYPGFVSAMNGKK